MNSTKLASTPPYRSPSAEIRFEKLKSSRRERRRRLSIESLESRHLMAIITVTSAADNVDENDGVVTLREAITTAIQSPDLDTIIFNINGGGPAVIRPQSPLPPLNNNNITIDGRQNGFLTPVIEIDGSLLPLGQTNFLLTGSNIRLSQLSIHSTRGVGVFITGDFNTVESCFIGLDASGSRDRGNLYQGIYARSKSNAIYGNYISGNDANGIWLDGPAAAVNTVFGNYIGTSYLGTTAIGNGINGILVTGGDLNSITSNTITANGNNGIWVIDADGTIISNNYIGSDGVLASGKGNAAAGIRLSDRANASKVRSNYIAGNGRIGIDIYSESEQNEISSNAIGLSNSSSAISGNQLAGIYVGSSRNLIGGDSSAQQNYISGNNGIGIWIAGSENTVANNLVGTDFTGKLLRGNTDVGVFITGSDNIIKANTLSGNGSFGVYILGINAQRNRLSGNRVGTDVNGGVALPNAYWGVMAENSIDNLIGIPGEPSNVISGNTQGGVAVIGGNASGNRIRNNLIGTAANGATALGNGFSGIYVGDASGFGLNGIARTTIIGGSGLNEGNTVSANGGYGIWSASAQSLVVQGNFIGTNSSGTASLGNRFDGLILAGDSRDGLIIDNTISGNRGTGIWLLGVGAKNNRVQRNRIGTNANGSAALGNLGTGVRISDGANGNWVGTDGDGNSDANEGNVISGNGQAGVDLYAAGTQLNVIAGNTIGLSRTGTVAISNAWDGVRLSTGAERNRIGSNQDGISDTLERNVVSGNTLAGIAVFNASSNAIVGNYVGTSSNGTSAIGNIREGIYTTGRSTVIQANVIAGNGIHAITLAGTNGWAAGNIIGLAANGSTPLPNGSGIFITGTFNIVGTNSDGIRDEQERNTIGGSSGSGIWINGRDAYSNFIRGNFIGTDVSGLLPRRNLFDGVAITNGASNNLIGTDGDQFQDHLEGNIISGSDRWGVAIYGSSNSNTVAGNRIGTDVSGNASIANLIGVYIASGSSSNLIGGYPGSVGNSNRNIISGNSTFGVLIQDSRTNLNRISGNLIGTTASGLASLRNGSDGININSNANVNSIESNVISGNAGNGITILNSNNTFVADNTIGLGIDGKTAIGQSGVGIYVVGSLNRIGPGQSTRFNTISANGLSGIEIAGASSTQNLVQSNRIGTDRTGTVALGNGKSANGALVAGVLIRDQASRNVIGSNEDGIADQVEGNLISGNLSDGIHLRNNSLNQVAGNLIGTDAVGTAELGNLGVGVNIVDAQNNSIGGTTVTARNLVSGNKDIGLLIIGGTATGNTILGNYIGTDSTGKNSLANTRDGVVIFAGANNNRVGAPTEKAGTGGGNVISGNRERGVWILAANANEVLGNLIGLQSSGDFALPNLFQGIEINGGFDNRIGGAAAGSRNIVSGNFGGFGEIAVANGNRNVIQGNYIGTDLTGTKSLGLGQGGVQLIGASQTIVGGGNDGEGNLISGNRFDGIWIRGEVDSLGRISPASDNRVQGNRIGIASDNVTPLGNGRNGVFVSNGASSNLLGSDFDGIRDVAEGNLIAFNGGAGLGVVDAISSRNTMRGNKLFDNSGLGIDLGPSGVSLNDSLDADSGANTLLNFPIIRKVTVGATTRIVGTYSGAPQSSYTIDFYSNKSADPSEYGEGQRYLGTITILTNSSGQAFFDVTLNASSEVGELISATATDAFGNTSEFSRTLGVDVVAPVSRVAPLQSPATSLQIPITVVGSDPGSPASPASGVESYQIFVSTNGSPFTLWNTVSADNPVAQFTAQSNRTYAFRSVARDWSGNVESKAESIEARVVVPDLDPPDTRVASINSTTPTFQLSLVGTDPGGAGLSQFDVFVQIDGGSVTQFATVTARPGPSTTTWQASVTFQAIADGKSHTYRFFSVGTDARGNVESRPSSGDVEVTKSFDRPEKLAIASFDVQRGASQRSFIRYIDAAFNLPDGVSAIVASLADADPTNDRVVLRRFNLDGSGQGQIVSLQNKVNFSAIDQVMKIDFGTLGLGENPTSPDSDGYYELAFDLDGDGTLESRRNFYRLLGDTNNDRTVNATDISNIVRRNGTTGTNRDEDINGDEVVNNNDRTLAALANGRRIAANLPLDD